MLKILTSLFILLNPAIGFFAPDHRQIKASPVLKNEVSSVSPKDYKLPLSETMFLASQLIPTYPLRNWNITEPEISAKIALVFETTRQKVLWQKNDLHEPRPIASLTKLMTALIAMENVKMEDIFKVSKKAVATPGEMGNLVVDEEISVENLLYALLTESSNDAAVALAEGIEKTMIANPAPAMPYPNHSNQPLNFINLMNQKAKLLGLADTVFSDPSGLDPGNLSSAWDLNIIMEEFLKYPLLQKITQTAAIDIKSQNGKFSRHLTNTNKLLNQYPEIIAGKTGYTEEAGNCMILAWRAPNSQGKIISIIIDSQDRTKESEALLKWTKEAYLW